MTELWQVASYYGFYAALAIVASISGIVFYREMTDDGSDLRLAKRLQYELAARREDDVTHDDHGGKPWQSKAGTRLDPERANSDWP